MAIVFTLFLLLTKTIIVTLNSIQEFCRTLPHTTEDVKWGTNLVFSVGNKMYAVLDLDHPEANSVSFKCSP